MRYMLIRCDVIETSSWMCGYPTYVVLALMFFVDTWLVGWVGVIDVATRNLCEC